MLDSELVDWCAGFLEAHMDQEEAWMEDKNEQEVAELLLPIAALSGIFSEEEFAAMIDNEDPLQDMADQLPEYWKSSIC